MDYLISIAAIFQKGGLVMYPLVACSILVVAVAIERFRYYRVAQGNGENVLAALERTLEIGDWDEAIKICEKNSGAVADVLATGLRQLSHEKYGVENALEGAAALAAARLRRRLDYLDTVVTLAPLLGLLGTVIGMISSFSVMNVRSGQPQAITGGVGEALVATATGLCVAILAMIIHSCFKNWLDAIITDMEQACTELIHKVNRRLRDENA